MVAVQQAHADTFGHRPDPDENTTTVRLSEVMQGELRFEASAYGIPARNALAALQESDVEQQPLYGEGGLCLDAFNAFRFARIDVDREQGVALLSSSELTALKPRDERFISTKQTPRWQRLLIQPWDVMVSCSGTIGNVGLAGRSYQGKALTQHAIRLSTADAATSGLVAAWLRCRYGRPLIRGQTYGAVVRHIEPKHLVNVPVPVPTTDLIDNVGAPMAEATTLRDDANDLLAQADDLLHERLGLPRLEAPFGARAATSVIKLSSLNDRFEASYHTTLASLAEQNVQGLGVEIATVGDERVTSKTWAVTRFRKRVYVRKGGIPLLNTAQIFLYDHVNINRLAKGAHLKDLPEIQLAPNMILVTCSGTIGRVQIVPDYMASWTTTQDALRVIATDEVHPGYLYAWLASSHGHALITRYSYGAVVLHIDVDMMGRVPVPLPPVGTRKEIGDLVLKANDYRDKAFKLEQEAIKHLEGRIEAIAP